MAKISKRNKKFLKSGGVKGRIEKGVIGKRRRRTPLDDKKAKKGDTAGGGGDDDGRGAESTATSNKDESGVDTTVRKKKNNTKERGAAIGTNKRLRGDDDDDDEEGDDEFTSSKNLGNLDMESFFRSVVADNDDGDDDDDDGEGGSDVESGSDDDDEGELILPKQKKKKKGTADSKKKQKRTGDDDDMDDDDESDSEDEDVGDAERRMKEEMEKLSRSDPEFHKFLKHNEGSLLDFDAGGGDVDDDDEEEMEEGGDADDDNDDDSDDEMDEGGSATKKKKKKSSKKGEDVKEKQERTKTTKGKKGNGPEEEEEEEKKDRKKKKKTKKGKDGISAKQTKKKQPKDKLPSGDVDLTPSVLHAYSLNAFDSHGIKGLRRLVNAYRTACHLADAEQRRDDDDDEEEEEDGDKGGKKKKKKDGKKVRHHIGSADVFDRLMVLTLTRCHEAFHYHLLGPGSVLVVEDEATDDGGREKKKGSKKKKKKKQKQKKDVEQSQGDDGNAEEEDGDNKMGGGEPLEDFDENKPINPRILMRARRWKDIRPILQVFFRSTLHILSASKEAELQSFVLKKWANYVPYMSAFPGMAKGWLKTLARIWSAPPGKNGGGNDRDQSGADYQTVRLHAFLRIRQLALTQPFPFIEDCLKYAYLAYAKSAKFISPSVMGEMTTLPTLTFMGNCLVELYSLDLASSYQHAFVYIRQLALHLRTALQKKTKESFQAVYCWQYVNCLKVWTAVLAANCGTTDDNETRDLRSLLYPLAEIIRGVARLLPTARYLPLRFHCVRLLQQLAASSRLFIPTTSILLNVLDSRELSMRPKRADKKTSGKGCRLPVLLKLPGGKDDALRTMEQLDACVGETFLLLNREMDLYRYTPAFPEFTIGVCQRLRKFNKETKVGKWRAYAKGCIELCDRHSDFATTKRSALTVAPKDVSRLEMIKPPEALDMQARYEQSITKERQLESRAHPPPSKKGQQTDAEDAGDEKTPADKKGKKSRPEKRKNYELLDMHSAEKRVDRMPLEQQVDEIEEGIEWSDEEVDDVEEGSDDDSESDDFSDEVEREDSE